MDTKLTGKTKLAKTTVGRETSTSEAVLTQLLPFHPLPAIVLEYRQVDCFVYFTWLSFFFIVIIALYTVIPLFFSSNTLFSEIDG